MRILHVVKTTNGARWAAHQARVVANLGADIHVALPSDQGEAVPIWQSAGATIHLLDCSLPLRDAHRLNRRKQQIVALVDAVQPDLIHTHFVTNALMLRLALGGKRSIPRIFQVPGPLHMEKALYRRLELSLADSADYWVASSRFIKQLYTAANIPADRLFLSYYGNPLPDLATDTETPFDPLIPGDKKIIGNVNYMYPPKYYLGQLTGLKRHEDVIDALGIVLQQRNDVSGLIVGGQWGNGSRYEASLRRRGQKTDPDNIHFAGRVAPDVALNIWHNFDCAIHVPISENCGGVVEPLTYRVPTIASRIGGLPEVIIDGKTGWLVPPRSPAALAKKICAVLDNPEDAQINASRGQRLVRTMFDVERTGEEIYAIYRYLLNASTSKPQDFDSIAFVDAL